MRDIVVPIWNMPDRLDSMGLSGIWPFGKDVEKALILKDKRLLYFCQVKENIKKKIGQRYGGLYESFGFQADMAEREEAEKPIGHLLCLVQTAFGINYLRSKTRLI